MVDELSKLTNGVLCLFIIGVLAIFGQIFDSFTPAVGSMKQKYIEILNFTWIITFYVGILVIFGNFSANICLVHSTCWLFGCIFAWIHGRWIFFRITQKIVPVLKYDESLRKNLTKIVKFEVNLGYQFWTNWVLKSCAISSNFNFFTKW